MCQHIFVPTYTKCGLIETCLRGIHTFQKQYNFKKNVHYYDPMNPKIIHLVVYLITMTT